MLRIYLVVLLYGLLIGQGGVSAQQSAVPVNRLCPVENFEQRDPGYDADGIILTYFDRVNLWAFDVRRSARFPLAETAPCGTNCHLSPDMRWISYLDSRQRQFNKMRLNGSERTVLAEYASEISWWDEDTLLLWSPTQTGYLRPEGGNDLLLLTASNIISVQPGGDWALTIEQDSDGFIRVLVRLHIPRVPTGFDDPVVLGPDVSYFNAGAWSPDGAWYAYVNPVMEGPGQTPVSSEIAVIRAGQTSARDWTTLTESYGPVRVNGHAPGVLSWSQDGTRLAFWVIPLTSDDPMATEGLGMIHVLDISTGSLTAYCGLTTLDHTPNPPRLIWSPDGNHLALAVNPDDDERGYLLITLDTRSGIFTELSAGIYPALGRADVIAWGLPPE